MTSNFFPAIVEVEVMFVKPIDLTKILKPYKSGWVAVNGKNQVIAHEKSFDKISKKVAKKKDIVVLPASDNYFGFVT